MAGWDASAPGKSAINTALSRAVDIEVSRAEGHEVGVIIWDFEKFFDTVDPQLLIQRAVELKFPLRDLGMALRMHLAPRALQDCGRLSDLIYPTTSILPVCGYSIPFTRLLLRDDVQKVVDQNAAVQHSVYVDDIGQHSAGSSQALYRTLRAAALSLAQMAKRLKLRISKKSTIVTSSRAVSLATDCRFLMWLL